MPRVSTTRRLHPDAATPPAISEYLRELDSTQDPARAGRLHFELGRLHERPLGDDRRAAFHYRKALECIPGHLKAVHALRLTLLRLGEYAATLPLFEQQIESQEDVRTRAQLLYRKGVVLEDRLRRKDAALQAYEAAVEFDPTLSQAWEAIVELTWQAGDFVRCNAALSHCADLAVQDPALRSALMTRRAQLLELKLDQTKRATEIYEAALRLDADNSLAYHALLRLLYGAERFADLAALLQDGAEFQSPAQQTRSLQFASALLTHKLENRTEALSVLRRANETCATYDEPLMRALADALHESGDEVALVAHLELQLAHCDDPLEQLVLHKRIGRLREHLGDAELARAAYAQALDLGFADQEVIDALMRLHESSGNLEATLDLLQFQLERESDLRVRTLLLLKKGLLLTRLQRPDEAITPLKDALFLEPDSLDVFRALETLYATTQRPEDLCALYRQRADLGAINNAERVGLLLKVAHLEEGPLDKPEAAAHTYRQVLRIDPGHATALSSLQHVAARAGLHEQLIESLELEAAQAQDVRVQAALYWRAAQVLLEQLDNRQSALSRLQRALSLDPEHLPSLHSLERVLRDSGRYDDLLDTLERRLELTTSSGSRLALLLHMAEIAEQRLGDYGRALTYARRAGEEAPAELGPRRRQRALLRAQGDYEGLAKLLEVDLKEVSDRARQAQVALHIAEIQELRVGDLRKALQFYEMALQCEPESRLAFEGCARIRSALGEYKRLATDLERRAETEPDGDIRHRLWLRAAELWTQRVGDMKRAQAALTAVSSDRPLSLDLLMLREIVDQRLADQGELLETLQIRAERCADPACERTATYRLLRAIARSDKPGVDAQREALLNKLQEQPGCDPEVVEELQALLLRRGATAEVLELDRTLYDWSAPAAMRANHLCWLAEAVEQDDPLAAEDAYMLALQLDNQSLGAARGLGRLALAGEQPGPLLEAARHEQRIFGNAALVASYLHRAANLHRERGEAQQACELLEKALESQPDNAAVAEELTELLSTPEQRQHLLDVLRRAAECATEAERKRDLWLRMSHIQLQDLDNISGALVAAKKAVEATPKDLPAILALTRLQRRNRHWEEAAELLRAAVTVPAADAPLKLVRDARVELATIYEQHLDDLDKAIECLKAATAADAPEAQALARLSRLQVRTGELKDAKENAEQVVALAQSPSARAEALLLLSEVQQRSDDPAALDSLCQAVAIVGPRSESGEALRKLLRNDSSNQQDYVEAVLQYCRSAAEPQVTQALLDAAAFLADVMGDPAGACTVLQTVDVAAHAALRLALARYQIAAGEEGQAAEHLRRLVQRKPWETPPLQLLFAAEDAQGRVAHAQAALDVLKAIERPPQAIPPAGETPTPARDRDSQATPTQPPPTEEGISPQPESRLSQEELQRMVCDGEGGFVIENLLRALRPAYPKLFPDGFDGYNVDPNQAPPPAIVRRAAALADRLGAPEYRLYVHRSRSKGVIYEVGETNILLVPSHLHELPATEQNYHLARPLLAMGLGIELMLKLTARELQILFTAAARQLLRTYGDGLTSEEVLNGQLKIIQRALPRRNRKLLEPLLHAFIDLGAQDLEDWVRGREEGLRKVAALACGDLGYVVDHLRREYREFEELTTPELAQQSGLVADLMRLWVSDEALKMRAALHVG